VQDIPSAKSLFETYFGFKSNDIKPNESLAVLEGENGFILVLMHEKLNESSNTSYPDAFHIGFYQENEEAVIAFYEKLKTSRIKIGNPPKKIRKTFGFYFKFQNILIEIASQVD